MTRARLLALVSGLALLALSGLALANMSTRTFGVAFDAGRPKVSFSARDLGDEGVKRALSSGIAKNIVVTVQAFPSGSERPLATQQLSCRVTFDLWEEEFVIRAGSVHERRRSLDEVLARCLDVRGLPLGDAEVFRPYAGKSIFFAVLAEFNPISQSRCQSLLRTPGSADPIGPVVVNIVRREICRAERSLEFRSQDVEVPR